MARGPANLSLLRHFYVHLNSPSHALHDAHSAVATIPGHLLTFKRLHLPVVQQSALSILREYSTNGSVRSRQQRDGQQIRQIFNSSEHQPTTRRLPPIRSTNPSQPTISLVGPAVTVSAQDEQRPTLAPIPGNRGMDLDGNRQGLSPTSSAGRTPVSEKLDNSLPSISATHLRPGPPHLIPRNVQARESARQIQSILQTRTAQAQPLHSTRAVQATESARQPAEAIPLPNDCSSPMSTNAFSVSSKPINQVIACGPLLTCNFPLRRVECKPAASPLSSRGPPSA
ncbi:hypothetical protein BKA70DRAFT_1447844 [Coprinopsis sp. MPI-PUGE-AT-0042]|nr:hypothetical protein BKA70DRAFT_1447844 [Coprinopsis sp. MPI-PUGE-AT-0042]